MSGWEAIGEVLRGEFSDLPGVGETARVLLRLVFAALLGGLLGWERALIYKTLVLTGLRKKELASLTAAQLQLGELVPYAVLDAADEKNREGNEIALRDDLAADLRDWLAFKLERLQGEARERGEPSPARLPPDTT